jgi:hypothetical protein
MQVGLASTRTEPLKQGFGTFECSTSASSRCRARAYVRGRGDLAVEILALLREEKPTLVLERLRAEMSQKDASEGPEPQNTRVSKG